MRATINPETEPVRPPDVGAVGRVVLPGPDVTADSSDLMASLPWWVSRGLLYVICGFVFCALLWAAFAPVDEVATARGAIIPEGEIRPIQALEAGTVSAVGVREGDHVLKGQTLVQLDDAVLEAHAKQARLEYEGAQVNLISMRDSGADVSAINDGEARVTAAKNALDAAQLALDRARLVAPVAGTVTYLTVHGAGAVVREGDVVANIAPEGARLVAEVQIPNEQMSKMRPGLPAKLLIDAYPYQQYGVIDGQVLTVSPDAISSATGGSYYRAVVAPETLKSSSGVQLTPGLALEARIVTDHRTALGLFLDPFRHVGKG